MKQSSTFRAKDLREGNKLDGSWWSAYGVAKTPGEVLKNAATTSPARTS